MAVGAECVENNMPSCSRYCLWYAGTSVPSFNRDAAVPGGWPGLPDLMLLALDKSIQKCA